MLHLVCPNCGASAQIRDDADEDTIGCHACSLLFRVTDNIVPQITPEAEPTDAKAEVQGSRGLSDLQETRGLYMIGGGCLLIPTTIAAIVAVAVSAGNARKEMQPAFTTIFWGGIGLGIGAVVVGAVTVLTSPSWTAMRTQLRKAKEERDAQIICPHCHQQGCVSTAMIAKSGGYQVSESAVRKYGVLGLLAGGSTANGVEWQCRCSNCGARW